MYDYSPDGVLFTAPDGRVLAANPAACEMLGRTEADICGLGRHRLADPSDDRWNAMLEERARTGAVRGVARMLRGDGTPIEVEMSARVFTTATGEQRVCTIMRDVTARVRLERELLEVSARLRDLTLTDELTGLRNRRGFLEVAGPLLELADRRPCQAMLMFLDVDNMKSLNDERGHRAGDAALRAVANGLRTALRRADALARIGGDEFVALALGLRDAQRESIERRLHEHLTSHATIASVGEAVTVSAGWVTRPPSDPAGVDDLLAEADRRMYRTKRSR